MPTASYSVWERVTAIAKSLNRLWQIRWRGSGAATTPIDADGRLYFFSQDGTTTVLKPGRTMEILATNTLANGFMASPAVSGRAFYLRTRTDLYRVESMASDL